MSTKRDREKFKRTKKMKNRSNRFENPSKINPNLKVIDLNHLDELVENFSKNVTTTYERVGNNLIIKRIFPVMGEVKIVITKTKDGFIYQDVGMFTRKFTDLDNMLWEFELPKSLKKIIQNLPISQGSKDEFETGISKKIKKVLRNPLREFLKEQKIIS